MNDAVSPAGGAERPGFQLDFSRIAFIIALVMIGVSGFTTFRGLELLFGGSVLAYGATAATILLLALTSWFLGRDLSRTISRDRLAPDQLPPSVPRIIISSGFFLVAFSLAAGCSFAYYFNNLFQRQQSRLVAANLPAELVAASLPLVRQAMEDHDGRLARRLSAQGSEALPDSRHWLDRMTALVESASRARAAIDQQIRVQREGQLQREAQLREATAQREALERDLTPRRARLQEITTQLADFDSRIRPLQQEEEAAQAEARREEGGIGRTGRPTCGPVCREHRARAALLRRQWEQIDAPARPLRTERTNLEAQIRERETQLAQVRERITTLTPEGEATRPGAQPQGIDEALRLLAQTRREFETNPMPRAFAQLGEACARLQSAIVAAVPTTEQFDCRPASIARVANERATFQEARIDFDRRCTRQALQPEIDQAVARVRQGGEGRGSEDAGLLAAQTAVERCIGVASNAGADIVAAQRATSRFVEANSTQRDHFAIATGAFSLAPVQATIAAFVSVVQEIIILALALFGDMFRHEAVRRPVRTREHTSEPLDLAPRPSDPPRVAASKLLLRVGEWVKMRGRQFWVIDLASERFRAIDPDIREEALAQLDSLRISQLAHREGRSRQLISEEGKEQLETLVRRFAPPAPTAPHVPAYARAAETRVPANEVGLTPGNDDGIPPQAAAPVERQTAMPRSRRAPQASGRTEMRRPDTESWGQATSATPPADEREDEPPAAAPARPRLVPTPEEAQGQRRSIAELLNRRKG